MTTANLTRRAMTLGVTQDTVTGYFDTSFAETTIRGTIQPRGTMLRGLSCGSLALYENTLFTDDAVVEGDEVKDAFGVYWIVKSVHKWPWLDKLSHYMCEVVRRDYAWQPTTSGTWHLDSDSARTDQRYRHRLWFNTYVTAANLKLDNGATNADYITCFDGAPYPISKLFLTKDTDLVFTFGKEDAKALPNWIHYPYAFEETATITCSAVNKSGLTATNLVEQAEQEIRHIATDYPLGSVRIIDSTKYEPVDIGGGVFVHTAAVTIKYRRINDDYTPTAPNFARQIKWLYEGDRLSGGPEGTWTLTQGGGSTCAQTITNDRNLYLNQTVWGADSYTTSGTDLNISTTLYPYMRVRYKTSGAAYARVDTDDQTVMAERQSSTFKTETFDLTAAQTLDHIILYACDGVGTVTYDFVQVFGKNYILPNCVDLKEKIVQKDALLQMPGFSGNVTQPMGSGLLEVTMTCDLDLEPSALTWRPPQTTTPKSAYEPNNVDILMELLHVGGGADVIYNYHVGANLWTWLDLGEPERQFKARLEEIRPSYNGEAGMVDLVWREYRHGSATGEHLYERYGLTL